MGEPARLTSSSASEVSHSVSSLTLMEKLPSWVIQHQENSRMISRPFWMAKKLTGQGTTAGGGDDSDEEGAGGKVMSGGDLAGAMEAFETGVAGVKGDSAVMDSAKKLMRAFLVLVQQSTFDTASKEFMT